MNLRRRFSIALIAAVSAWPPPIAPGDPPSSPANDVRLQGAYRSDKDGWIYVHLEGSPEQIGFQHGSLLAAEIADFLRVDQALSPQVHQARLGLLPASLREDALAADR